jgi:chemotaxis protein MotB
MRSATRRRREEEEGESVFVSMTDMTVSFLFIVMILLAFFASQFRDDDTVSRDRFERAIAERDDARRERDDAREERDAARAEVEALTAQLAAARERIASLEPRVAELERQRARAERARDEALAEIERLREEISRLETRLAALQGRLAEVQRERDEARAEVARLRDELATREARIAELEAEVDRLQRAIADLEAEIERLRDQESDPLEAYMREVAQTRRDLILERLRDAIKAEFPDLEVEISTVGDALRFKGEGWFATGQAALLPTVRPIVEAIAAKLDTLLPCYTLGPRSDFDTDCNPSFAVIEAVQVEGHTDSVGGDAYNMQLSASRGASTYAAMTEQLPQLVQHLNLEGQPVLSVAGYGEGRPVETNQTAGGRAENRRIDLRFIMVTPRSVAEIEEIRDSLRGLAAEEPTDRVIR